jgi:hypothetical protein
MNYREAIKLKEKHDGLWGFAFGNGLSTTGYNVYLKIIGHYDKWENVFEEMRNKGCSNESALKNLGLIDSEELTVWMVTDPYRQPINEVRLDEYVKNNPEIFRNY